MARKNRDLQILVKLVSSGNFEEAQKQLHRLKQTTEGTSAGGVGAVKKLQAAWGGWTKFAQVSAGKIRTAFLTVLGPIGAIITIVQTFISVLGQAIRFVNDYQKAQQEANLAVEQSASLLARAAGNKERYADATGIENLKAAIKAHGEDLKDLAKKYDDIGKKVQGAGQQWWNVLGITSSVTQKYQEQLALLARQRQETQEQELAKQRQLEAEERLAAAVKKREEAEHAISMRIAEIQLGETEFKKLQLDLQLQEYEKAGASRVLIEELKASEIARIDREATQKKIQEEKKRVAEAKKLADAEEKIKEQQSAAIRGMFNDLASFQSAKSKELGAVGKAAASAETLISTYVAAQKAFSALAGFPVVGPALGTAAAAAAIAAGLARVAAINAVQLETGGVTTQETLARIGEKGKREGVLPLEDPRAMRMVGEAISDAGGLGAGSGTKIENHFHGFGWDEEEFARRVTMVVLRQVRDRTDVGRALSRAVQTRAAQDNRRAFS